MLAILVAVLIFTVGVTLLGTEHVSIPSTLHLLSHWMLMFALHLLCDHYLKLYVSNIGALLGGGFMVFTKAVFADYQV